MNFLNCFRLQKLARYLMLLELPLRPEHLLADVALLRILSVVDLEVKPKGSHLLEAFVALRTLKHPIHCVNLDQE